MIRTMENSYPDRLSALAHYVIARTRPDQLGATKLNKVLWWLDCSAYRRWGRSLSGVENYVRMKFGPVPVGIQTALASLKSRGEIHERSCDTPAGPRREFVALAEPPIHLFTAEEVDQIMQTITTVASMSAAEASTASHDALWDETEAGAAMSIAAGSVVQRDTQPDDIAWARAELERLAV
jgi:hypothetical protein